MADLSRTQAPTDARRRGSANRDFTIPNRRDTSAPELEINAGIRRPNDSAARQLLSILQVGQEAADSVGDFIAAREGRRESERGAAGALAGARGDAPDPEQMERSRAYADAYYTSGAQRAAVELAQRTAAAVQARLADPDDPATLDDVNEIIDREFSSVALDEQGLPRDFGSRGAALALGNVMRDARQRILSEAIPAIRQRTDRTLVGNVVFNVMQQGLPEQGAPLVPEAGDVRAVEVPASVPAGGEAPAAAPAEAPAAANAAGFRPPTGRLPARGTITSNFASHSRRGSPGIDIDGRMGDPVELPASGRVIEAGYNARAGHYIIVDHGPDAQGRRVTSSYSHLSSRRVREGATVQAGDIIGGIGNSGRVRPGRGGDGSHLHYRVKVDGRDVDPSSFTFEASTGTLAPAAPVEFQRPASGVSPTLTAPVRDFNAIMDQLSVVQDQEFAKNEAVQAIINFATDMGQPEVVEGLIRSTRRDGTPWFTQEEGARLRGEALTIRNRLRTERDREKAERQEANGDALLLRFVNGEDVPDSVYRDAANNGDISPQFAFTMIERREQEAREAAALERQEDREADMEIDMEIAAEREARQLGDLRDATYERDLERLNSGELGTGRAAASRFRQLRNAARAGADTVARGEQGALYAQRISDQFPIRQRGDGSVLLNRGAAGSSANAERRAAALARYRTNLTNGMGPAEAYQDVMERYGPQARTSRAALTARERELSSRQ